MELIKDHNEKRVLICNEDNIKIQVFMTTDYTYLPNERLHGDYVSTFVGVNNDTFRAYITKKFDNGRFMGEYHSGNVITRVLHY